MAQSTILDITGQPFKLPDLFQQQTETNAKLAHLRTHYGEHPSSGLTPQSLARILKSAEHGDLIAQSELAEDMEEKDAHIQSELGKRRLAWRSVDWNIVPPPDATAEEQRDAEMVEYLLRSATWFNDAIFDAGDAILKGFSHQELTWEREGKEHYISAAEWKDPSWFQVNPNDRNQLTLRDGSHEGEALQPFGWISHVSKSKSGYISRNGLARVLAWPFLFKNYSVRDLAEFLEIYGLPMRLGKYPTGASPKEINTLLRAVMSIGHNAGGVIPQGMAIEFEKAAEGQSDPFMAMINWCERSQSKAILGGTLTSQADGKSSTNALGNVHNEVRKEIRDADLTALGFTLTRDVVYPMYVLNGKSYTSPRRIPRLEFDLHEEEDWGKLMEPMKGFIEMGMEIEVDWMHERTRIPKAAKDKKILQIQGQPVPPSVELTAKPIATLTAEPLPEIKDQNAIDGALKSISNEALQAQAEELIGPLLERIQGLEPDEIAGVLADAYPDLQDDKLQKMLAQMIFVSELWGRVNAEEE